MSRSSAMALRFAVRFAVLGLLSVLAACSGQAISTTSGADSASASSSASATSSTSTVTTTTTTNIAFAASRYSVTQSAGSVAVGVHRSGATGAAATVKFTTSPGSATAGSDYTSTSGTLQWAENDATDKTITVAVNPREFSGQKSFTVALTDPSSGAAIGSPGSASVTIDGSAAASVGSLELADALYTVADNAGSVTMSVNRSGGAVGATSVNYATSNGTAVAGKNYTAATGTLHWDDGDSAAKSFVVPIIATTPFTGKLNFVATLSDPGASATLGSPASAVVTIMPATAAVGTVELGASGYNVAQNAGAVSVSVKRTDGSSGAVTVSYATKGGTAVSGTNFTARSGTLSWEAGDNSTKTFSVPVSNATPFSGDKSFSVALSDPSTGASITNPGSATVVIAGDAAPAVGSLQLSAASYSVGQGNGSLTVSVTRSGGSSGAVGVSYSTSNGTAVGGTDFTAASGTLSWADGDTAAKSFSVPISNATPFAGTKSFTITLGSATGGAAVGSPSTATAAITGDAATPAPGNLQFSSSGYSVGQAGGSVSVTVHRTGGSSGAVSVSYSTANGSADAGSNYTATSGTLNWADGNAASQSFSVPVSNATPFSGSKTFTVALSDPTGNASLSSPNSATVTINGSAAGSGAAFSVYQDGVFNWAGDYSYDANINYADTAGGPLSGSTDIAVTLTGAYGAWLPYGCGGSWQSQVVNGVAICAGVFEFINKGYTSLTFAIKPTTANWSGDVYFVGVGDVNLNCGQSLPGNYGPNPPVANQWNVYTVPLSALCVAGAPTLYKFGIQDQTGLANDRFYIDNVGFQ